MSLYKSISWFELTLICIFCIFYLIYFIRTARIAGKFKTHSRNTLKKFVLRSIYFILMLIALLGPSFGEVRKEIKAVGKDIYIAVDLSLSMNANDIPPSRLEKVKYELKNILNSFRSDRIGLIIFSSEAFVQCPLTYDQNALSLFIETLNSDLVPNAGTDLESPLKLALEKHLDPKNTTTSKQSKIILVISDGEDFEGNLEDISEKVSENGIKVFTLGVGTSEGGKIPFGNSFKTDKNGKVVNSRLNEEPLKKIAIKTNGNYFKLNEEVNEVEKMINAISVIEGELRDTRNIDASANKYYYFLVLALILICFDVLFTSRTFSI